MATLTLPEFDLELSGGGRLRREDLLGRRTVLYFYPKDDTPGCTIEAHEFSSGLEDYQRRGVSVYGVSPDTARSHDRFVAKCELSVPLIADPEKVLIGAFGLWKEKSMYGRTYMGVARSTVLVGPDGGVEHVWSDVKPKGHSAEVLSHLDSVGAAS